LMRGPELVLYNGVVVYEVLFGRGAFYIDANTGQVLSTGGSGAKPPSSKPAPPPPSGGGEHGDDDDGGHDD
ncbi:MAG TPA: PepSY domain-containing protein, partial [Anaerolineae bacterium]